MDNPELSPQGRRRREAILRDVLTHAKRRRRTVAAARVAGVALVGGLAALAATVGRHPPSRRGTVIADPMPVAAPPPPAVAVTWIETDPTLFERLKLPEQKPTWTMIDDDQLLRTLADTGRPAALAVVEGRVELLWRDEK